jgi:hypothetical protein
VRYPWKLTACDASQFERRKDTEKTYIQRFASLNIAFFNEQRGAAPLFSTSTYLKKNKKVGRTAPIGYLCADIIEIIGSRCLPPDDGQQICLLTLLYGYEQLSRPSHPSS